MRNRLAGLVAGLCCWVGTANAAVLNVPLDYATIQSGLNAAQPGDTVRVCESGGPYFEKIAFPASGTAGGSFISLEPCPGDRPVLDGTGVAGANMVTIASRSYVRIRGFEIRNNLGVNDGSGIRVVGSGSHIEILDNEIHDIRGQHAMGITVYGTEVTPISEIVIDGNVIYDCEPFQSEALVLNANVTDFAVTNNVVRDVNNIGIDFIGGETDINSNPDLVARNGVCRGNVVLRANQQGGGYAGGIYVDGGRDILIERNVVGESDLGIEIGAENAGIDATGIVVRNNFVYANLRAGIVFGGFSGAVGRVRNSSFLNNTTFGNDTELEGFGELWIQHASDNVVRNNVFVGTGLGPITYSENGNSSNALDYNLWYSPAVVNTEFAWRGDLYTGFAEYQSASGQDAAGLFADPLLADPGAGDLHLAPGSPAINAGDPTFVAGDDELDFDGADRINGWRVDIGADETTLCGDGNLDPGEECDDGNPDSGDGCDANCTPTGCGNDVMTPPETCDDGNLAGGDCCSATCELELAGFPCDDGDLCSSSDVCDGSGVCAGEAAPLIGCKGSVHGGKAKLLLKDGSQPRSDLALFRLARGEGTDVAELGDPTDATEYTLCVYDAVGSVLNARTRAGETWRAIGSGYRYRDAARIPEGVQVAKIKAGAAGKTVLKLKGKGERLEMPALGLALPVVAQLRNDAGGCWGASFSAPTTNDEAAFKATSD